MNNYFTGKSVDDAIDVALESLNLSREQVEITVIEEASKGIFGIGAHPAKIMVTKKEETKQVEVNDDDLKRTVEFLQGLFEKLDLTVSIETRVNEESKIVIDLTTANSSSLIGYRGEILDSIQYLASAVYNDDKDEYQRVVVDCENYREKREQTLYGLADRLAQKAIKTGRKVCLEPMNPFERRIIHSAISEIEGVTTESEGKEPNRYVVIIPDGYDPANDKKSFKVKGGDRRGKNDRRGGKNDRRGKKDFSSSSEKPKKKFGAGVYLGNSLKDNQDN